MKPLAPSNKLALKSEINAHAMQRWQPLALAEEEENSINVFGGIGDDWWSESDVTVERVQRKLKQAAGADVVVNINSFGGDMFEGFAIYNLLAQYSGKVSVRVLGLAASAASIIAMAGDEVAMSPASFLMIHNSWVYAAGNRHDFTDLATSLKPFDEAMASIYANQTGMDKKQIMQLMDAETWINGDDAIIQGFATQAFESEVKAEVNSAGNAIRQVDNLLAKSGLPRNERRELLNQIKGSTQDAAPKGTQDAAFSDLAFQAELLSLNLQLSFI